LQYVQLIAASEFRRINDALINDNEEGHNFTNGRLLFAMLRCLAMDKRAGLILIAAALIVAPKLRELKDSPAL
jgi:hypothetical protein